MRKWFQLVGEDGKALTSVTSVTSVSVDAEDVDTFRDAVKAKCPNSTVDASELKVFADRAAYEAKQPMDPRDALVGDERNVFIVQVPDGRTWDSLLGTIWCVLFAIQIILGIVSVSLGQLPNVEKGSIGARVVGGVFYINVMILLAIGSTYACKCMEKRYKRRCKQPASVEPEDVELEAPPTQEVKASPTPEVKAPTPEIAAPSELEAVPNPPHIDAPPELDATPNPAEQLSRITEENENERKNERGKIRTRTTFTLYLVDLIAINVN